MVCLSNWKSQLGGIFMLFYLFTIISIQLFILGDGQVSLSLALSLLLVVLVLLTFVPYLRRGIGRFAIQIQEGTDRKREVLWGWIFFACTFVALWGWYKAYYPGVFLAESIDQYRQVLSGEYHGGTPVLQTWLAFALPLKLTGKEGSIVLFQIVEFSAVTAYMLYVLLKYGGKRVAVLTFLYIVLNPVTGNAAICPRDDTTFAMLAALLMTFGLQIHMTDGKWLASKAAIPLLTLVMLLTTFVSPRGILFTVPFLAAVLLRAGRKERRNLLIFFVLGMEIMRTCFYFVSPPAARLWSYESVRLPTTLEELKITDIVFGIDGKVDWGFYQEIAENDLGLAWGESGVRALLQAYTEFTRTSLFKFVFWCAGVLNLLVLLGTFGKCRLGKREDWKTISLALPFLCYNFGTMLVMTWSDFRYFHMSFLVCPLVLMILFGKRTREGVEEAEETAVRPAGGGENRKIDWQYVTAAVYACLLFVMNFIMAFNINFWSDEGYSIMLSRMSFPEMIQATAGDVHPPLYYILLRIFCKATGFRWLSYRLLSVIPYGILLVFAMTVIWKKFGREPAIIWITFASLLNTSIEVNVQVRMYSWGTLFVMMSFYFLYEVLHQNRARDYIGFVLMSLGAAYTHYYCLISVAFFYLILLLVAVVKRKEYLKKVLTACVVTVLAYLPWFFVLLKTFQRTSEGYWMDEIPTFRECLLYLFTSEWKSVFTVFFLAAAVIFVACETGVLKFEPSCKGRLPFTITVSNFHMSKYVVWLAAGFASVFGTALVGITVSKVFRPMFTFRYIFPVSAVAWLLLGLCLAKYKKRAACMAVIVALILQGGLPNYIVSDSKNRYEEERLKVVLDTMSGNISEDDVILTDVDLFVWVDVGTYFPENETRRINAETLENLDENTGYWVFTDAEMEEEQQRMFEERGYQAVIMVEDGNLARNPVFIYRLDKVQNK